MHAIGMVKSMKRSELWSDRKEDSCFSSHFSRGRFRKAGETSGRPCTNTRSRIAIADVPFHEDFPEVPVHVGFVRLIFLYISNPSLANI